MKKCLSFLTVLTFSLILIRPLPTFAAVNPQDLNQYIQQIGLSQQDLTNYLSEYNLTLNDFTSVDDLKSFLGQPLNAQTLPSVLNDYGLTEDQLNQILSENGMSLNDYQLVNELETDLDFFTTKANLSSLMNSIGLTDEEMANLSNHFSNVDLSEITPQLEAIGEQLSNMNLGSLNDLSAKDQQTLLNTFDQMLQLFQLQANFYLEKDNQKQPISLSDLVHLSDPNGANLIIDLQDLNGQKLADLSINANSFNSNVINNVLSILSYLKTMLEQTMNGGQLPNTATHLWDFLALGLFILIVGAGLLKRSLKKHA